MREPTRFLFAGKKSFERYLCEIEERGKLQDPRVERKVREIVKAVREKGDVALLQYTFLFDKVRLSRGDMEIARGDIKRAYASIPEDFVMALRRAGERIRYYHEISRNRLLKSLDKTMVREPGIRLGQITRPLDRVGIYVPGGKAAYPSSLLMCAIPAKVAGVREIIVATPPGRNGLSPAILVAADIAGVSRIFRVGGVQAIAALAYGTDTVPKVDMIVGPGNQYVAAAKRIVFGAVDIDMVAGPSEIVIISDEGVSPAYLAADLISQAEHDEMAIAILITPSEKLGSQVMKELNLQLRSLRLERVARESLGRRGAILVVKNLEQAADVANRIAPEHLEIALAKPYPMLKKITNAGCVFLGPYTPEAIGDYMAGPSHVLPTAGTARFFSPLGIEDFLKRTNMIEFSRRSLKYFDADMKRITQMEGMEGHYRAFQMRLEKGEKEVKGDETSKSGG